jgi:hypothetical protein
MSKGVILRMDRRTAYVFTTDCGLVRVRAQAHHAVGKEIVMEDKENRARSTAASGMRRWAPVLAAALVLVVGGAALFGTGILSAPAYATVSVDINPSMEMTLDRNLEVLAVKAMNEDAKAVLATVQLRHLYWKTAVERWVEAVRATNRFPMEAMLVSAVMPEDALRLRTELQAMQESPGTGAMTGIQVRAIFSNDPSVAVDAKKAGLSVGRQMLWNQAEHRNMEYDGNAIAEAPLGELLQKLLQNREMDQTGYTWRYGQDPTGQPSATGGQNQNGNPDATPGANQNGNPDVTPEGNQEQNQTGGGGQNQERNGDPSGTPQAGEPSCTPSCTPECTPGCDPTGGQGPGGASVTPGGGAGPGGK